MTIRWGILGCGGIAGSFAKELAASPQGELGAAASRSADKAAAFCAEHGGTPYGGYAQVLGDDAVDAVYVALPNDQHARWAIAAAEAGKAVLCEKPACMTAAELEGVLAACTAAGTFFMENFAWRCHRRWDRLGEALDRIGELRRIDAAFGVVRKNVSDNIRDHRAMGGGVLMDLGAYCLSFARLVARLAGSGEPRRFGCLLHLQGEVDHAGAASLGFADGAFTQLQFSHREQLPWRATIAGSDGWIEVADPWCFCGEPTFHIRDHGGRDETIEVADIDGYLSRPIRAVAEAIAAGATESPAMSWADSRGQAAALDALRHAADYRWPDEAAAS